MNMRDFVKFYYSGCFIVFNSGINCYEIKFSNIKNMNNSINSIKKIIINIIKKSKVLLTIKEIVFRLNKYKKINKLFGGFSSDVVMYCLSLWISSLIKEICKESDSVEDSYVGVIEMRNLWGNKVYSFHGDGLMI